MKSTDNDRKRQKLEALAEQAKAGSKEAVEEILIEIQDMVFNLSLRMLGTIHDAEDASQEILIKVMTHLSGFRGESAFTTWVFSIATNHLLNYKKHLFANAPLSFEFYGEDIVNGKTEDIPDMSGGVDKNLLEEELKMSCTNVMLQCLDGESRCIYILVKRGSIMQSQHTALIRSGWSIRLCQRTACRPGITCRQWSR